MNDKIQSRSQNAKINSLITLITQFFKIIFGFLLQKIFIISLGVTYLGYNSVFTNILQMLNLADMGIGVAITSYLYKPLSENNTARIAAIMSIYKKLYSILGFVVLGIGLIVSIFLGTLIPDATCSILYLRILFYINLIGTASTYFLAYKRTLLIADQKSYLTNIVDIIVYFIIAMIQLGLLLFAPNYIVYLILNIARNIISNIILSIRANKEYGYINEKPDKKLIQEYKPQIFQYVKDVFVSKIGAVVYYGTDNVILSVIKGSLLTGYLSNYTLITGQLNNIVTAILSSVQATFGNFINATDNKVDRLKMTDNYFCVNFCIGNFCMICFSLMAQPFVKLFFGEGMLLSFSTAMWLGVNLLLTFLIQLPSQVFVIYKLFRYDRPIIIVSASLNIIISIVLVYRMEINGVLVGTFVTSLIYLFSRFYIIAKIVYKINYWYYVKKILYYSVVSIACFFATYLAAENLSGDGLKWFCVRLFVVGILSVLTTAFFLSFSQEFEFLKNKLVPNRIRWITNKPIIVFIGIVIIALSFVLGGQKAGNKSYERTDSYATEVSTGQNVFSLSFDDTISVFEDINENKYDSIFQNATLSWYKELHNKYGVVISCYCYYADGDFNLSQMTDNYLAEFVANSDWLRFGFHTVDGGTNYKTGNIATDYEKTIHELERVVGKDSIDNVVRLQMFQGSYDEVKRLTELPDEPIVGLLTADDNRQSYYLDAEDNRYIYCHDELYDSNMRLYLFSTDFRTEYVDNIELKLKELDNDSWNYQTGDLVVFSHEWALSMENKEKLEVVCKYAKNKGYKFKFFEDCIVNNQ